MSETWPEKSETWMRKMASEHRAHIDYWKNCKVLDITQLFNMDKILLMLIQADIF